MIYMLVHVYSIKKVHFLTYSIIIYSLKTHFIYLKKFIFLYNFFKNKKTFFIKVKRGWRLIQKIAKLYKKSLKGSYKKLNKTFRIKKIIK